MGSVYFIRMVTADGGLYVTLRLTESNRVLHLNSSANVPPCLIIQSVDVNKACFGMSFLELCRRQVGSKR